MHHQDTTHERTRLLASPLLEESSRADEAPKSQFNADHLEILALAGVIVVLVFGEYFFNVPGARILEDIICRHYYEDIADSVVLVGEIDEKLCKGDAVQQELAIVISGLQVLTNIPCLLLAFPYGLLADKIGRKWVFILALLGNTLCMVWHCIVCWWPAVFPLRLIWLAPLFTILGGGDAVAQNMVYAMASDLTTEATRANTFFFLVCGTQIAQLTAPAIAAYLMSRSPWIPRLIGPIIILGGIICSAFLRETIQASPDVHEIIEGSSNVLPAETLPRKRALSIESIKIQVADAIHKFRQIPHITPISLLLTAFVLHPLTVQTVDLVGRYISKRFSWTLAQTSYLLSVKAAVNILLLLVILPYLSKVLISTPSTTRWKPSFLLPLNLTSQQKDLHLARHSLFFLIVGSILLALSAFPFAIALPIALSGLTTYTLGTAFLPLCRSLLTTLVTPQQVARLYAIISVIETIGSMISAPGIAWLYSLGMRWSKLVVDIDGTSSSKLGWLGLPFWGIAAWYLVTGGWVWCVRISKRVEGVEEGIISAEESEFLEESVAQET